MIKKLLITILILAPFSFSHAQTILFPSRGGTGLGSVTAGDIGKCLAVSNNAPFAFTLGDCSGGGGTAVGWASTTLDINSIYFTGGSTGNVGIGTTTPTSKLNVLGDIAVTATSSGISSVMAIRNLNNLDRARLTYDSSQIMIHFNYPVTNTNVFTMDLNSNTSGFGTSTPYATLAVTNTQTNPSFVVEDSTSPDTTPFIIDASGNVGIGTIPVYGKVEISSPTLGTNALLALSVQNGTNNPRAVISHVTSATSQYVDFGGSYSSGSGFPDWIFSTGNVGIGTTTPNGILTLNIGTDSVDGLVLDKVSSVDRSARAFFVSGTNTHSIFNNAGNLQFYPDATVGVTSGSGLALNIGSAGNVGVATTSYAKFGITNTGTSPSFVVEDSTSPDTTPFIIDASGNVGIGTPSPSRSLEVLSENINAYPTSVSAVINSNVAAVNGSGTHDTLLLSNGGTDPSTGIRGSSIAFKAATYGITDSYSTGRILSYFDTSGGLNPGYPGGTLAFQYPTTDNAYTTGMFLRNGTVGIATSTYNASYSLNVHNATTGFSRFVGGTTYFQPATQPVTSRGIAITPGEFASDSTITGYNNSGGKFILSSQNTGIGTSTVAIAMDSASRFISFSTGTSTASGSLGSWANERMRLTGQGFLGIGTTTPGQHLSVAGDILGNNIIGSYFTATSTSLASVFPYASTTALTATTLCLSTDCRTAWPAGGAGGSGAGFASTTLDINSVYFTGGATGKIGIGTSTPNATLTIATGKSFYSEQSILSTSTSMTVDFDNGQNQLIRTGVSDTTVAFSNGKVGQKVELTVCNPTTTSGALSFTGNVSYRGGISPSHTTTANECDIYVWQVNYATSTAKYFLVDMKSGFK